MTAERVIWFRRESPRVVRDDDSPLPSCFMDTDVGWNGQLSEQFGKPTSARLRLPGQGAGAERFVDDVATLDHGAGHRRVQAGRGKERVDAL
jgi:hypothetical protein